MTNTYNIAIILDKFSNINIFFSNLTEKESENKLSSDQADAKSELVILPKRDLTKSSGDAFSSYLRQISQFPVLSAEEEYSYAKKFKDENDKEAAKILVQSHLRLVVKIATKFRGYGLPVHDLISEGNIGLIKAVKKFDPDKGFRFSTYAMWWVKANIQEYILRSWSLVKIGTTAAQKKLFFNLNKIKKRLKIGSNNEKSLSESQVEEISEGLNVSQREVRDMDSRLSNSDSSLNVKVGEDEDSAEMADIITSDDESQEDFVIDKQEKEKKERILRKAFSVLNEREKDILIKRQMSEVSATLDDLSKVYKISKERIRQVEKSALEKIKKEVERLQK